MGVCTCTPAKCHCCYADGSVQLHSYSSVLVPPTPFGLHWSTFPTYLKKVITFSNHGFKMSVFVFVIGPLVCRMCGDNNKPNTNNLD